MKKSIIYLVTFLSIAFMFNSCTKEDNFDEALLAGKWLSIEKVDGVNHQVYYKYVSDGTGSTWDITDNVTENEAQAFTWTLKKAELTQIHIMSIGGNIPKVYTVTELTTTSLKYHDGFGVTYLLTKV
jgi:hypothetical protein